MLDWHDNVRVNVKCYLNHYRGSSTLDDEKSSPNFFFLLCLVFSIVGRVLTAMFCFRPWSAHILFSVEIRNICNSPAAKNLSVDPIDDLLK